ncbi:MAG TPA: transglutaminase family protein [Tepidisphaeraceae bacterium]|nr:transglutaminase family protein [Tepidisphaeraceae bacterium]
MYVRIGFDLQYNIPAETPMLLMLHAHPERLAFLRRPDRVIVEPAPTMCETFIDAFGNRATRILAPAGRLRLTYDNVAVDSGLPEPTIQGARLHPVQDLPTECLPYLMSSRYCEVDVMSQMAWDLFGKTPATWERVQAVMDWVHARVQFGYQYASPTKTAKMVCDDGTGVCRDFQHVAITLLRALNVPARYATGYLGDIGVPANPSPMDFSAWFEVYLGSGWYTLDARHHKPRIARVLMARGRDATDVALTTSFGVAVLEKFLVWTDEVSAETVAQMEGQAPLPGSSRRSGQPYTTHTGERQHRTPAVEVTVNPAVLPSRPSNVRAGV